MGHISPALKKVGAKRLLFVMATTQEYGPQLQKCFEPLITGVGPVEAAISVAAHITKLRERNGLPDLVISLGSAGSQTLQQTGIFQARSVTYRDMDASALGFEKGVTPFLEQPARIDLPIKIEGLERATLSTGANIVSGEAYQALEDDMVDMESYAVARVCQTHAVPLICLRGISDGRDELRKVSDWTQFLEIIDGKLAEAVQLMESQIIDGRLKI